MKEENVVTKVFKSFMSMVVTVFLLASLTVIASAQTPPGYVHKEETLTYECNVRILPLINIDFPMDLTIRADVPVSVAQLQDFNLLNGSATAIVPGSIIQILDSILGWNYVSGTVDKFEILSENQSKVIDLSPLPIPTLEVPKDGSPLVFTVPEVGVINVESLTAGEYNSDIPHEENVVIIKSGNISATFMTAGGGLPIPLNANCQPPSNNTLVKIQIKP